MDEDRLLDLAEGLARQAAAAILAVRAGGFEVERKRDASPVTAADRIAEALILDGLREATPAIPVVAEEEAEAGLAGGPAAMMWLVDPLDGTRDFAAGRDHFTVNIGLLREGRPWLGVLAVPVTGEVFSGIVGRGAWRTDGAGRTPIRARAMPPGGATVLTSFHGRGDPRIEAFLAERKLAEVRPMGSAEKFCRIAEGTGDLYPRFGTTMEWDTAAGEALVVAAGGRLQDWSGAPLLYGKPGWRNPGFLALGAAG